MEQPGIGAETTRVLTKRGVKIVVPARDLEKGAQLKEMIQKESPEAKILLLEIDLGTFASIKSFCSEFLSLNLPLNILINNAGRLSNKLELPKLFSCLNGPHVNACEISWMLSAARRANVTINAVHPGIVKTGIIRGHKGFLTGTQFSVSCSWQISQIDSSAAMDRATMVGLVHEGSSHGAAVGLVYSGASTTCYVVLSPKTEGVSRSYFADCNESQCSSLANDESEALQLWNQTRAL
ncbi:hypothetical protein RJ640_005164 [Escallonia rubra]|uniref:Uncharacterized protein n=1 Tax=Escallonia rubra TaxID=112253 RepID=A0AA88UT11_9ASTE|nr:hypothetical protein RJ640_005164 [Escallonia rubra]